MEEFKRTSEEAAYFSKPELQSDKQPPQEMPLAHHSSYGLQPCEMSGNARVEISGISSPKPDIPRKDGMF